MEHWQPLVFNCNFNCFNRSEKGAKEEDENIRAYLLRESGNLGAEGANVS